MICIIQTYTVGNLRIDFKGFFCNTATLVRTHRTQCPHIMQTVGKFNDNHAYIFGHCQNQFAETLRLMLCMIFKFEFFKLGQTVHHFGNRITESCCHLLFRNACIFQHIVHYTRTKTLYVHMPNRKLCRNGNRMRNVWFATFPGLSVMSVKCIGNGLLELNLFFRLEIGSGTEKQGACFGS